VSRSASTLPLLATLAYMVLVVAVLIAPARPPHGPRAYLTEYELPLGRRALVDVMVNVALFVPIGWGLHRAGRRRGVPPAALLGAVGVTAAVFSGAMETIQFWLPRYSSIIDVAANTAGGLLGAWSERVARAPRRRGT
jgi:VanZ family protein